MSTQRGSIRVAAPPSVVRRLLLQPLALPQWNPAFRAVEGPPEPSVADVYSVRTVLGLSGALRYPAISEERVEMSWQVPGFAEDGVWELRGAAAGTVVTHTFTHTGPLAAALRPAYRGVADLRLQRLADRAAGRRTPGRGPR